MVIEVRYENTEQSKLTHLLLRLAVRGPEPEVVVVLARLETVGGQRHLTEGHGSQVQAREKTLFSLNV